MYSNILRYHQYIELIKYHDITELTDKLTKNKLSETISNIQIPFIDYLTILSDFELVRSTKTGHIGHTVYLVGLKIMLPKSFNKLNLKNFTIFLLSKLKWQEYPYYSIYYKIGSCYYLEIFMSERYFYNTPIEQSVYLTSDVWILPGKGRVKEGTPNAYISRHKGELLKKEYIQFSSKDNHLCFSYTEFIQWRKRVLSLCRQFFNIYNCEPKQKIIFNKIDYSNLIGLERLNARKLNRELALLEDLCTVTYNICLNSNKNLFDNKEKQTILINWLKKWQTLFKTPIKLKYVIPKLKRTDQINFSFAQSTWLFERQLIKLNNFMIEELDKLLRQLLDIQDIEEPDYILAEEF